MLSKAMMLHNGSDLLLAVKPGGTGIEGKMSAAGGEQLKPPFLELSSQEARAYDC